MGGGQQPQQNNWQTGGTPPSTGAPGMTPPTQGPGGYTTGGPGITPPSTGQPGQVPPTMGQPPQQTGGGVGPGLWNAQEQLQKTISGDMLNPQSNQYLQNYYNAAAQPMIAQYQESTAPDILGNAVKSGNLFSSAPQQQMGNAQEALSHGLATLGANIYEPAYQQERQLQQQAIGMEPGIAQSQYLPAQMLQGVGSQQQQLQQSLMNYPMELLSGLAGLVGPGTGGSGTNVTVGKQPGSMK